MPRAISRRALTRQPAAAGPDPTLDERIANLRRAIARLEAAGDTAAVRAARERLEVLEAQLVAREQVADVA